AFFSSWSAVADLVEGRGLDPLTQGRRLDPLTRFSLLVAATLAGTKTSEEAEPPTRLAGTIRMWLERAYNLHSASPSSKERRASLWSIACDRTARLAVKESRKTIKADAARLLFDLSCRDIRWVVIDSGIDATHPCLVDEEKALAEPGRNEKWY